MSAPHANTRGWCAPWFAPPQESLRLAHLRPAASTPSPDQPSGPQTELPKEGEAEAGMSDFGSDEEEDLHTQQVGV